MMRVSAYALIAARWLGLLAVFGLSLFHWRRAGYWELSGAWQYGLLLLDPRIPAALLWWVVSSAFWILLVFPLGRYLAERIPATTGGRRLAVGVLALGLGTRGVVGPLLVRAAAGSPLERLPGGGEELRSWLAEPLMARWLVVLTQAWWVLPLLVVGLWLLGPAAVAARATRWKVRGLLAAFALMQPLDAPYLLTAGGPQGATQSLLLIAFREGFGRQEFGYACVLTLLLCLAALPVGLLLQSLLLDATPGSSPKPLAVSKSWLSLAALTLLPLGGALCRNPGAPAYSGSVWSAAAVSLGIACLGGVWTGGLGVALSRKLAGRGKALVFGSMLFPPLVLVLPMIRPWGYRSGALEVAVMMLGLLALAPHLSWTTIAGALLQRRGVPVRNFAPAIVLLAAWAGWTELGLDVMLSQHDHPWLPLQGRITWELATVLRRSPLETPGWPLAWVGGVLLAWAALTQLFHSVDERSTLPGPGRQAPAGADHDE